MSKLGSDQPESKSGVEGLLERLRDWWQRGQEIATLDRAELDRMAMEFGMTPRDLANLVARGPGAADLLYQRLGALGVSRGDVERVAPGLARDLERTCSCCDHKGTCRTDLESRPDDPAWEGYCPNAIALESVKRSKGRFPA